MKNNFSFSIITPTLNNGNDIEFFLKSIRKQTYPKNKVEIIIADGGSVDKTVTIAKKYKAKVIKNTEVFADIGVNEGIKKAKGDLLMVLACDNIFKSNNALETIAKVFEDKRIYAAFPKHAVSSRDNFFTKYINTFTDPANHFVYGYASNPRTFHKIYKLLEQNKYFSVFDFKSNPLIPMIAFAQGFTIRSGFKRSKENAFDDTAPVIELLEKNKIIAYVHSVDLYHHTIFNLSHFINKQAWKTRNYLQKRNFGISHRVKLLSKQQTERIRIWPLYSLTIIPPFAYSLFHLIKDREPMWIFHPFLCIISGYTSFFTLVGFFIRKNLNEIFHSR